MGRYGLSNRQLFRLAAQVEILRKYFDTEDDFTVLDAGTEFGHTGRTVKEAFPRCFMMGVEIHEPTYEMCFEDNGDSYDILLNKDVFDVLQGRGVRTDVIIAAEIVEHFEKEKGWRFLELLQRRTNLAIVTSPIGFKGQRAIHDNPHEEHKSGWEPEEFEQAGWTTHLLDRSGYTLGVYYWRGA